MDLKLKIMEEKTWLDLNIEESKTLEDADRLERLREIAEDIANEFTYSMAKLEAAIEDALDEVSKESKEETGYWYVCDITQDIDVIRSSEHEI